MESSGARCSRQPPPCAADYGQTGQQSGAPPSSPHLLALPTLVLTTAFYAFLQYTKADQTAFALSLTGSGILAEPFFSSTGLFNLNHLTDEPGRSISRIVVQHAAKYILELRWYDSHPDEEGLETFEVYSSIFSGARNMLRYVTRGQVAYPEIKPHERE